MSRIGRTCTLKVIKRVPPGAILDGGELGEVLLPDRYCPDDLALDDQLPVFLYLDSQKRAIATTQKPRAEVDQFAFLEVVANSEFGAFVDWGLDKDLLVPFGEQHRPMRVGHRYIVHVYVNRADGRILASSKIEKFLEEGKPHTFWVGQPVDLIIANSTDLGFKAVVNHSHWGLLYKNELNEQLSYGQSKNGFVKFIRPDGKIDLALDAGQDSSDRNAEAILMHLQENEGFAAVNDKSDARMILSVFGMSKRTFKKTIGGLYKRRLITIDADGIRLTN
ncbi:MAG: S1-like domain-containing RNA-binding protein [Thermoanaerobaculales bacterium]|jgi:predicted RNA-binding protein (virulence factor B family)|nr:S1-like domain-containing RNA-binding protein [Thermoanaerobaculales bacterium]